MKTVKDLTIEQVVEIACLAYGNDIIMYGTLVYDPKLNRVHMSFDYDECGGNTIYIESNLDVFLDNGDGMRTMNQFAIQERFKSWGINWS